MIAAPLPLGSLRPPPWASALAPRSAPQSHALFAAGAALAALDARVRAEAPFDGAWRRRLALKAAAASGEGRAGDETGLRDAQAFTPPGGDPGPSGRAYRAWRRLSAEGERKWPEIAAELGAPGAALDTDAPEPAPLAAAAAFRGLPRAAGLAAADIVLAARLNWRAPLPLLALEIGRARPSEADWPAACCAAYARAAARACDLHAELGAAAARLEAVAPKLRAKGAGAALARLLDDDAISSAAEIQGLSDRALRRLFDRLVKLGAVRELTGRATFRLYGL